MNDPKARTERIVGCVDRKEHQRMFMLGWDSETPKAGNTKTVNRRHYDWRTIQWCV